jgi:hypothetical protein
MKARDAALLAVKHRLIKMSVQEARGIAEDVAIWSEIGPQLTCTEMEAFGTLLLFAGVDIDHIAELVVDFHGAGDNEPDDMHANTWDKEMA